MKFHHRMLWAIYLMVVLVVLGMAGSALVAESERPDGERDALADPGELEAPAARDAGGWKPIQPDWLLGFA